MSPIKFLEPEIAERIEEIVSHIKTKDPIKKLCVLKNLFDKNITIIYNGHDRNHYNIYDKHYDTIKNIIENHPEQLLLHFATYNENSKSHASFATPISEELDCITTIRKYQEAGPSTVVSYLKRKDSDIQFDLTLVDTYDLDYEDNEEPYVMSYLYGNPYDEDWQHSQKTEFKAIDDAIENNNEGS